MSKANGTVVDPEQMQEAMLKIVSSVIQVGVVTDSELREQVGDSALCTRALQTLKTKKFITKSNGGPDFEGATIWTLQNPDLWRGKDPAIVYLQVAGAEAAPREDVYKNYQLIDLHIQLLTPSLGGTPTTSTEFVDLRRAGDHIWLQGAFFRACMRDASRLVDVSQKARQAIKNKYVYVADVFLPADVLTKERIACPAPQGKGITRHEAIAANTIIDFAVKYPDLMTDGDVRRIWAQAGVWIGFSQAKHNQGWGRFKLLE